MHDNHNLESMSDWDLSQLSDEDDEQEDQEVEQEYSGELPW
jgi:hypothetical protein